MSKKHKGYAVYSSMLSGVLAIMPTMKEAQDWITSYYAANGTGEQLRIIPSYPY